MGWWSRLRRRGAPEARGSGASDFVQAVLAAQEAGVLRTSMGTLDEEQIGSTLSGIVKSNGPIFALTLARMQVFSQARFQWARYERGEETDLFGSPELGVLERPWPGGTTADLLARMELDVTAAGNAYIRRIRRVRRGRVVSDRLVRLRPDWVTIVLGSEEDAEHPAEAADVELLGYVYTPNGDTSRMVVLEPDEVAHYAPVPDPDGVFVGMSWVTPVIRDVLGDNLQTDHKRAFLRNSAPQPLDAKVLTPSGWSTMGEMTIGSRVIGSDGKPHRVTGVYPQGEQEIYRVRFQDGGATECTMDHLWTVACAYDRKRGVTRTLTLRALVEGDGSFGEGAGRGGLRMPSGGAKWAVPMADPVEFDPQPAPPVDPYLLGLLLGDGSFRGNGRGGGQYGGITLAAAAGDVDEIVEYITPVLPEDVSLKRRDRGGWSEIYFKGPGGPYPGTLKRAICDLGLWGKGSRDKFIPRTYLTGAIKDRVALLQGLIDSDGSVSARQPNLVTYTTSSDQLAADVVELVHSLGGLATMRRHGGRDRWTVVVKRLPDEIIPARLLRKASRYQPSTAPRWRSIIDVEYVGVKEAQCIRVDVDDHLYVTDDFILTHNTPNLVIKFDPTVTVQQVKEFKKIFEAEYAGAENAYKTLFLGGGADPQAIGANFKEIEFSVTQGKAESRLAAAAGVPPSWVGFSEGLQGSALNAGNFTAARRRFGDGTLAHLWENAAASLQTIVTPPDDRAHLAVSTRGIPFLAMDASDRAAVQEQEARTIVTLVKDGFTHASAVDAVINHDWSRLEPVTDAEGNPMLSVQLQSPQANPAQPDSSTGDPPAGSNGGGDPDRARAALIGGMS